MDTPTAPPPPVAPLQLEELLASSEPQYISASDVRQNKLLTKRTESPDNDSAFCENTSSNSSTDSQNTAATGGNGNGAGNGSDKVSSSSSSRDQITATAAAASSMSGGSSNVSAAVNSTGGNNSNASTLLKMKVVGQSIVTEDMAAKAAKAEKIRLAIEKIKEASIKKIFIKVFGEDGSAKSLLVDERMTVSQVGREKIDCSRSRRSIYCRYKLALQQVRFSFLSTNHAVQYSL